MNWQTIVLICVLAALLVGAVIKYVRDNKKGKCSGGCAGCSRGACPDRKKDDRADDKPAE
ncbi:MAG: FeoB-associated Cys-rich membrane protein [Clostridia bacterium]|nr:FeoB-associated Cys-rich membrane protein [Clostridia bacterium]